MDKTSYIPKFYSMKIKSEISEIVHYNALLYRFFKINEKKLEKYLYYSYNLIAVSSIWYVWTVYAKV